MEPEPANRVVMIGLYKGINWEGDNVHGVIFVQAPERSTKEILQAAYVE
jgi:hypothetical protein